MPTIRESRAAGFAKIVKDKFNLEINIIAPNISGDAVYQTRAAAGELGDIIHLSAEQMKGLRGFRAHNGHYGAGG